jgi:ring-1,2-phenylacetyl-CoA epoxidase subunit PaaB
MAEKDYDVYEVFIQRTHTDHHVHVGSLIAPTPDVAVQTARENFLRREKAVNIWVVPRNQITATPYESDFLSREMDRKYREVSGYTENGRLWRMFKEKAISLEEIVDYVKERKQEEKVKKAE